MKVRGAAAALVLTVLIAAESRLLSQGRSPGLRYATEQSLPAQRLRIGGATINVTFGPGHFDLPQAKIMEWVSRAAHAVTTYYGRFPVREAGLRIEPEEGRSGVFDGVTWGYPKAHTRISVGEHTSQEELDDDWMMTHEMTHYALPDLPDENHWLEEGIAVYAEPIARVQAGQLSVKRAWASIVEGMPNGEPAAYDEGLDRTHTWGRTYWGGALYCLLADVKIHECTHNVKGLQDALRGILNANGNIESDWPIANVIHSGDEATGCTVMADLYKKMKDKPYYVDLYDLWKQLGVVGKGDNTTFNDQAPLAAIRRAITARR
jgi:hypothetical protein